MAEFYSARGWEIPPLPWTNLSPPFSAAYAFDCAAELEANVARYAGNRARLLEALPAAGFGEMAPADGAFYAFADVSGLTADSAEFC